MGKSHEKWRKMMPDTRRANNNIKYLRENGAATAENLPSPNSISRQKGYVGKILPSPSSSSRGYSKNRGRAKTVYFLYGMERMGIRVFIEENTEFVAGCMEDKSNIMVKKLDPIMWQMVCEEWAWGDYGHD